MLIGVRGAHIGMALVGAGTGISVILVAWVLIGVCTPTMMPMECYTIMKPSLLVLGLALIAVNAILLWKGIRPDKA